jgi:Protein phosphatase 2C.
MSAEQGKKIIPLSRDHKPTDEDEQERILSNGGKIYQ